MIMTQSKYQSKSQSKCQNGPLTATAANANNGGCPTKNDKAVENGNYFS
jgi:uncharacterized protein YjcR